MVLYDNTFIAPLGGGDVRFMGQYSRSEPQQPNKPTTLINANLGRNSKQSTKLTNTAATHNGKPKHITAQYLPQ